MVDKAALGAVGVPFTLDVERGKIHEFARAVRSTDAAHFTGDHPVAPPTFLTTTFFWEELVPGSNPWALVKMDPQRGMHAEQEYVFHGPPPRAGVRLTCQSRIAEILRERGPPRRHPRLRGDGHRISRRVRPPRRRGPPDRRRDGQTPGGELMSARWDDLAEGATGPAPLVIGPLTRTDFVRYQGASGDMNPVHHDEVFARAAGYPAPLGVGMFPAGALNTWATSWLGADNVRRTRVRWREQVWPGDVLTCSGKVARRYVEDGERWVDVELVCTRQGGGVAIQGWATFVVPE